MSNAPLYPASYDGIYGRCIGFALDVAMKINLSKENIDTALSNPKLEEGLLRYLNIQKLFPAVNVSEDKDFQRYFNTFYKVIKRSPEWYRQFYGAFQATRCDRVTLREILEILQNKTHRVEASFGSKLLATIDPSMPVIDSIVLKNLGLRLPYAQDVNRLEKIVKIQEQLKSLMTAYIRTSDGKYLIQQFKESFPYAKITKIKMLDLVLWQTRIKKHILKKI